MNRHVPILLAVLAAGPALAQMHSRAEAPDPAEVLAKAGPEVQALFSAEPNGLLHKASGFKCPRLESGVALTGAVAGAIAGSPASDAAYCEYSDKDGKVAYLAISRDAPSAPVLETAFCRNLPKALGLTMGAGVLPGVSHFAAPAPSKTISIKVRGEPETLWLCDWTRAPVQRPIVVASVAAARASDGWTVRAIHTPKSPPCCRGYREAGVPMSFYLLPVSLLGDAVGDRPPHS
jgi:hypothetical protein